MAEIPDSLQTFRARGLSVTYRCRGGAHTDFLQIPHNQEHYELIIISIGSNDLDDGKEPDTVLADIFYYAWLYVYYGFTPKVVVMSLFPRASLGTNTKITHFNSRLKLYSNDYCVGWLWSRKLTIRLRYDGVHLTEHCYRRALKYLTSPMLLFGRIKRY